MNNDNEVSNKEETDFLIKTCEMLANKGVAALASKIPKVWIMAHALNEDTGEMIVGARLGFWDRLDMYFEFWTGGFRTREHSLENRPMTEAERINLEKFLLTFCSVNGLRFTPTESTGYTGVADAHTLTYQLKPIERLFTEDETV